MLKHGVLSLVLFGLLLVVAAGLFRTIPMAFLPDEDQGYFITVVRLPDGASKKRTDAVLDKVEEYYHTLPAIYGTQVLSGQNFVFNTRGTNTATMFTPLKPWDERTSNRIMRSRLSAARSRGLPRFPVRWCWPSMRLRSDPGSARPAGSPSAASRPGAGDFKSSAPWRRNSSPRRETRPCHRIGQHESFRVSAPRAGENQSGTGQSARGTDF